MSDTLRSYAVARKVFSVLEIVGWITVALGVIVFLAGTALTTDTNAALGMGVSFATGMVFALLGLLSVAASQNGRASVDGAEYGQQSLSIAREELEISRQAFERQFGTEPNSFSELVAKPEVDTAETNTPSGFEVLGAEQALDPRAAKTVDEIETPSFSFDQIEKRDGKFFIGEQVFESYGMATDHLIAAEEKFNSAKEPALLERGTISEIKPTD